MSELTPKSPIRAIRHAFEAELPRVKDTGNEFAGDRLFMLKRSLLPYYDSVVVNGDNASGLIVNAVEDMWFIGNSAFSALRSYTQTMEGGCRQADPVETVTASLHQLSELPSSLPNDSWQIVQSRWSQPGNRSTMQADKIEATRDTESDTLALSYSDSAATELESYLQPEVSGCPAKGLVLSSVFELFIENIFAETTTVTAIQALQ